MEVPWEEGGLRHFSRANVVPKTWEIWDLLLPEPRWAALLWLVGTANFGCREYRNIHGLWSCFSVSPPDPRSWDWNLSGWLGGSLRSTAPMVVSRISTFAALSVCSEWGRLLANRSGIFFKSLQLQHSKILYIKAQSTLLESQHNFSAKYVSEIPFSPPFRHSHRQTNCCSNLFRIRVQNTLVFLNFWGFFVWALVWFFWGWLGFVFFHFCLVLGFCFLFSPNKKPAASAKLWIPEIFPDDTSRERRWCCGSATPSRTPW